MRETRIAVNGRITTADLRRVTHYVINHEFEEIAGIDNYFELHPWADTYCKISGFVVKDTIFELLAQAIAEERLCEPYFSKRLEESKVLIGDVMRELFLEDMDYVNIFGMRGRGKTLPKKLVVERYRCLTFVPD